MGEGSGTDPGVWVGVGVGIPVGMKVGVDVTLAVGIGVAPVVGVRIGVGVDVGASVAVGVAAGVVILDKKPHSPPPVAQPHNNVQTKTAARVAPATPRVFESRRALTAGSTGTGSGSGKVLTGKGAVGMSDSLFLPLIASSISPASA